jgi:hypothetical protein
MKLFRFGLNLWMTLASLASFLLGWAALAHSLKPVQPVEKPALSAPAALPTLMPLQSGGGDGTAPLMFQAPDNSFSSAPGPVFRSGGS